MYHFDHSLKFIFGGNKSKTRAMTKGRAGSDKCGNYANEIKYLSVAVERAFAVQNERNTFW